MSKYSTCIFQRPLWIHTGNPLVLRRRQYQWIFDPSNKWQARGASGASVRREHRVQLTAGNQLDVVATGKTMTQSRP